MVVIVVWQATVRPSMLPLHRMAARIYCITYNYVAGFVYGYFEFEPVIWKIVGRSYSVDPYKSDHRSNTLVCCIIRSKMLQTSYKL